MKKLLSFIIMCGLLAFAAQSFALSINPGDPDYTPYIASGVENDNPGVLAAIASIVGTGDPLYKMNVGGTEEGILAGSYDTTFNNAPDDPSEALIQYMGGSIVGGDQYLLVKDGNINAHPGLPSWYLFDLTSLGWDGMEDLALTGFWPNGGAISYVALYGTSAPVPEPGTLLLLGSGITGLALFRKRMKS